VAGQVVVVERIQALLELEQQIKVLMVELAKIKVQ
jgi:hypothetical protein